MAMLSPQEQQMVMNIPPAQRPQAVVALVQQRQARQQAQQLQQQQPQPRFAGAGAGLDSLGFVPNSGMNNMRQGAPQQQQQGLGLQLPGMLGQQQQQQQQHSINPFTAGGQAANPQYRFNPQ